MFFCFYLTWNAILLILWHFSATVSSANAYFSTFYKISVCPVPEGRGHFVQHLYNKGNALFWNRNSLSKKLICGPWNGVFGVRFLVGIALLSGDLFCCPSKEFHGDVGTGLCISQSMMMARQVVPAGNGGSLRVLSINTTYGRDNNVGCTGSKLHLQTSLDRHRPL